MKQTKPQVFIQLRLLSDLKPYYAELVEKQPPIFLGFQEPLNAKTLSDGDGVRWGAVETTLVSLDQNHWPGVSPKGEPCP